MSLEERTGTRDLTFSRWHRSHVPSDCSWIDIDCCHFCRYCNSLLALFELVRSEDEAELEVTVRRKVAAITERVGIRLGIPVFKIAYAGEPLSAAAVIRAGKPGVRVLTASELAHFIDELHDCAFCRQHRNGRYAVHRT